MNKIFVISDTHFNHQSIIDKFEFRKPDYWEQIIRKINSQLEDWDILIHLWDVIFDKPSQLWDILKEIKPNITKILVRWNHDRNWINFYLNKGFNLVVDEFKINNVLWENIIFSHKPLIKLPLNWVNIHWHLHTAITNLPKHKYFCYSAENENYMPLLLNNIINKIKWEKQLYEHSPFEKLLMLIKKMLRIK